MGRDAHIQSNRGLKTFRIVIQLFKNPAETLIVCKLFAPTLVDMLQLWWHHIICWLYPVTIDYFRCCFDCKILLLFSRKFLWNLLMKPRTFSWITRTQGQRYLSLSMSLSCNKYTASIAKKRCKLSTYVFLLYGFNSAMYRTAILNIAMSSYQI